MKESILKLVNQTALRLGPLALAVPFVACAGGNIVRLGEKRAEDQLEERAADKAMSEIDALRTVLSYSNGSPALHGLFVNGVAEGRFIFWNEEGSASARGEFVRGLRSGWWEFWEHDGSKDEVLSGFYVEGRKKFPPPLPRDDVVCFPLSETERARLEVETKEFRRR